MYVFVYSSNFNKNYALYLGQILSQYFLYLQ